MWDGQNPLNRVSRLPAACLPALTSSMSDAELLTPARSPLRQLTSVQIISTGSYVPEKVVTNEDLASLGCDADWIVQRTGIRERRHAPPEIAPSDMALVAAERCFKAAEVDRGRIDLLVLG